VQEVRLHRDDWQDALGLPDGRRLIVAGPGTGKTEFLIRQVVDLVDTGKATPSEIIVLSFSRRSSARLKTRIEDAGGVSGQPVDVGTFHSLALRLIESVSGGDRPIPLTTPEQVALVREMLEEENPNDWPVLFRGILATPMFSGEVADFLLRCSERLLGPNDLAHLAERRADWRGLPGLYGRYMTRLDCKARTDYGTLLAKAAELLDTDDGRRLAGKYRYVLVDEYQDTSPAQAAMAEALASEHGNLTVAGDPYQSIFSFRGAEIHNIATFEAMPGTTRIVLDESFRVPAQIMDAALRVVSSGGLPGAAGPVKPASHEGSAEAYVFDQDTAEAEWIAREVEHLIRVAGVNPSEIAVLVRTKKEFVAELSRAFGRREIPHDPPENRLVDHPAVRLIQDLVTVAIHDNAASSPTHLATVDSAVRRILLGPLLGVPVSREREMARERRRTGSTWSDILASNLANVAGLISLLDDPKWATDVGAASGFWEAWTRLDQIGRIVNDPAREKWRRAWAALSQALGRQADRDPNVTLERFFEMVDDDDFEATPLITVHPRADRVTLTTLHQAKGLEFDYVFIANAVEGVFPDLRRSRRVLRPELLSPDRIIDPDAQQLFQVQEEMRLAYTAMTRARLRVVWSATAAGVDQGGRRPSRFLLSAAGETPPGAPDSAEREPLTLGEAESSLRRTLTDAAAPAYERLAAAATLAHAPDSAWDPGSFPGVIVPGPSQGVLPETFHLSPSQAASYDACPRRYVLERRIRLGDPTSVWAHFGELVHDVLEHAEAEVIGTDRPHADLVRVLEIAEEVWAERADFGIPALTDAWKSKAEETLTNLYTKWPGKGPTVAVEHRADAEIGGVSWTGRIDRIEESSEGLRIVDYKTSTYLTTYEEAEQSIQLGYYAIALARERGRRPVASEMWFPRIRQKTVPTRGLAMHLLPEVEEKLSEITASIRAEDWEPRVSKQCGRCSFKSSCPAWPEGKGAYLA
jgi:superfamily I DNA/RNA helicase/RecB family exonuclease